MFRYGDGKAIIEILNIGFEPLLTEKEYKIYKEIGELKKRNYSLNYGIKMLKTRFLPKDDLADIENDEDLVNYYIQNRRYHKWLNDCIYNLEEKIMLNKEWMVLKDATFRKLLTKNTRLTRKIYDNRKFRNEDQFRNIAIFESDLTRCFDCKDMEHSDDIISVVTYYTEIFDSIIHNGFNYNNKHYVFFTAGAGQTRTKKSTFVFEEKLNEVSNRLFCGLTREKINELGGMNSNKFLAYTSLCQTNSEIWQGFNIDRAIVVEDIEYEIPDQKVRYIYTESPEDKERLIILQDELDAVSHELKLIKLNKDKGAGNSKEEFEKEKDIKSTKKRLVKEITQIKNKYHKSEIKIMNVVIPFTDGFGISLKRMESSMVRLPFMKGLIAYAPRREFIKYCIEHNVEIHEIMDIYGKHHSINDIDYIFTKSQFKMCNYFRNVLDKNGEMIKTGWEVYKDNFKKYGCDACRCNVERKVKMNAKTNYQILQTLTTEMTDNEIKELAAYDIDNLNKIGKDVQCMLNILGANEEKNDKLSYLQKSLILYPEMLKDYYVKTLLKNTKNSMITKFRSGKFNIDGSYIYAIPDTLACLQWWFTDERDLNSLGFVNEGEVACKLFDDNEEVDCLRSPHLDHAHCIRTNRNNKSTNPWVKSYGVYVGVKDIMSKLLMNDNDGDKLLLHRNKTIINCAKRFQDKYKMIPNYYDMPKANATQITDDSLYEGIILAYHHGNIGTPSNEITKVWSYLNTQSSKEEIEEAIEVVALRTLDVNFTIDYAKTLYKPTIPLHILKKYKKYSGKKLPHFFIYAKGKKTGQVEELKKFSEENCNIDRIYNVVKSKRIVFKNILGKYSYKMLMKNSNVDKNSEKAKKIVDLYESIDSANIRQLSYINMNSLDIDEKKRVKLQLEFDSYNQRKQFVEYIGESVEYITDVLVKSLQGNINKDTLWKLFGDVIYENIKQNLGDSKLCEQCRIRFTPTAPNQRLCDTCGSYQPQGTKIIKCVDCGKEVEVDSKDNSTDRCEECYRIYRKKYKAIKEKERRKRLKINKRGQHNSKVKTSVTLVVTDL